MSKIVVLSTDTLHHRYFLNSLEAAGLPLQAYLFETERATPPFPVGPVFEAEEDAFERERFFVSIPAELQAEKIRTVDKANSPAGLELLRGLQPDLGVVFGTGKLSVEVIRSFRHGLINVHRGIAQAYRGLDSDLWAIYHGDYANLGVTIHRVEEALDTGDVVHQQSMPLHPGMRTSHIRYYTTLIATELVAQALRDYLAGNLAGQPQQQLGRYYSFMPLELKRWVAARFDRHCAAAAPTEKN